MRYPWRPPKTSASLETSSKSAPKTKDVGQPNRQTARDIPAILARTEAVRYPWRPPPKSAETSEPLETFSHRIIIIIIIIITI